ncbi:MAG: acyl-CoA dehydrogenase family protein [Solirubrobacterales bacterium]
MNLAEQGTSAGLRALNRLAGSELLDRIGLRDLTERLVHGGTRNGFRAANAAGRRFAAAQRLAAPARQRRRETPVLFDLEPTDEQQMMIEAFGDFARERLRPAAQQADADCAAPAEVLAHSAELGVGSLGVPEELGGAVEERSAVTSALITEALAGGDMGIAFAVLAPAAVSTAIGLWGDAEQQATYLPAFTGDDLPTAALAVQEPGPLFDPFDLAATARRSGDGWVLDGEKSLVPGAAAAELFVVAAATEDGPGLFVVEPAGAGLEVRPEPAIGLRAAATGRLRLDGLRLPAGARLGDADAFAECVRLARIAWAAMTVGTAQGALDFLIPYVNERKAFGEPISHRQAVAFNMSDLALEIEGMRLATYRAASLADRGEDVARAAAVARQLASAKGMKVGSDAVGLLGGHGYVKEYPVERWYRDLRAAGVVEGGLLV